MLKDIIPAAYRRAVYACYAVAATIVGALAIADVDTGKAPDVLAYLGIAVGAVAAGNTDEHDRNEDGVTDVGLLVGVLVAILLVVLVFGR